METEMLKYNVFLRIKPLDVQNVDDRVNSETLSVCDSAITTKHTNKKNELVQSQYNFKKVFKPSTPQSEVFDRTVCPRLMDFFQGNDSLVFSYGASNSGKSFTMQGTPSDPGIIPRVLHSIFQSIEGHQDTKCCMAPYLSCQAMVLHKQDVLSQQAEKSTILENLHDSHTESHNMSLSGTTSEQITMVLEHSPIIPSCLDDDILCSVWISFYEIYNEQIYDLLAFNPTSLRNSLKLGYDKEDDSYHPLNLKEIRANTWDEAYNLYRYGKKNLHVAETLLNRKSSRSHCVFTVKLLTRSEDQDDQYISVKSFILCDLAGSERMKHTDNMGKSIVKEMQNINTSLLTLNKCFVLLKGDTFRANRADGIVLPYRDSKLTMLFKRFLKGKGQLTMVANISQEADMFFQTEQVLRMTSLAINTRVEKKHSEKIAFRLPLVMPKRRFSVMMANEETSPVSGLRPLGSQNFHQEVMKLKRENVLLENEKKKMDLEWKKIYEENKQKDVELATVKKEEECLRMRLSMMEKGLEQQGTSVEYYRRKTFELEEKYRTRVLEANKKELDYHTRLTAEQNKFEDLLYHLKIAFGIHESTGPQATVQQVVMMHRDTVDAATEEVAEFEKLVENYKEELSAVQKVLSERDDEIANLKGRLLDLETNQELEDVRINRVQRVEISDADDETTKSLSHSDEFLSNPRVKSHGAAVWISDDESSPVYMPLKFKTTGKKKKKPKKTNDIPSYGFDESSSKEPKVRRARRQLLGNASDYLGDTGPHHTLDHTIPDIQMSPGTIMKKTLRSGKQRL